jgi:hypothetical protein
MKQHLSREDISEIRKRLFLHLDGWVLIPTLYNLKKLNVLQHFLDQEKWSLAALNIAVGTNEGYLNVALRILASQGYLLRVVDNESDQITLTTTTLGAEAFKKAEHYQAFYKLIVDQTVRPRNVISKETNADALKAALIQLESVRKLQESPLDQRMTYHMEGLLMGSILVGLGINKKFKDLDNTSILTAKRFDISEELFDWFMTMLGAIDYVYLESSKHLLTEKGLYHLKRASSYGVTLSYLPTFAKLETLLIGDPHEIWKENEEGHESHVYRYMNVWGSGGAHSSYFKKVDQIILELFNRPIGEQPKGIIDVGCGDGTFISHVYEVISKKTLRGKLLEKHPLFMMGVDYNKKARMATRETFKSKNIPAYVGFGDISNPEGLNDILVNQHGIELIELLNTRTFLDHNRIYQKPKTTSLTCQSDGAFAHRGRRIPNNELFQNLTEHFNSWSPFVKKFGLLAVELHAINPILAASNIGKTLATPYEATHGYSDQYIMELPSFLNAAKNAGLIPADGCSFKIPDEEKTSISIQLLKGE